MNKFLAVIGLALIVAASVTTTQAQVPTYGVQTLWSTNGAGIPAATAVALNSVIDCRKQANVALQVTAQGDTSVAAGKLVLVYSVDGVTFSPSTVAGQFNALAVTPTTAGATIVTNLATMGCGYIKAAYYTNDTGAAVTNMTVKYAVKVSAP